MSNADLTIVIDIGGTNTRLALADGVTIRPDSIRRFRNANYPGLAPVLAEYLADVPATPSAACAAIAGPVKDGRGTLTNLDWTVDKALLQQATGAEIASVINDLQAPGHALAHLDATQAVPVRAGADAGPQAARLVVNVGTGMNVAAVFRTKGMTVVPPAEAGHVDLPTPTGETRAFADFMVAELGFCSLEDALSGRGLERIYRWQQTTRGSAKTLHAAEIMQACTDGTDPVALDAVGTFCRIMAISAANLALTMLPFGGLYLVGGVARAVLPYFDASGFEDAFTTKGRFSEFLKQFPIYAITDDYAPLIGMAGLMDEIRHGPHPHD
jgi:glucokinase